MISVGDGDFPPPPPFPLDLSGSVSDSRSASKSGFVTIIRFVGVVSFIKTRGSVEEKVERATEGRLDRVVAVGSVLVAGKPCVELETMEKVEGDVGGEMKTVFRRAVRIGVGGGCGIGIGGK